jgi:hypothetical protein
MVSAAEGSGSQTSSDGQNRHRVIPNFILGGLLASIGVVLVLVAYFLNPLSYVGLEVPGSGLYIMALGLILAIGGLALSGTPDGTGPGT